MPTIPGKISVQVRSYYHLLVLPTRSSPVSIIIKLQDSSNFLERHKWLKIFTLWLIIHSHQQSNLLISWRMIIISSTISLAPFEVRHQQTTAHCQHSAPTSWHRWVSLRRNSCFNNLFHNHPLSVKEFLLTNLCDIVITSLLSPLSQQIAELPLS